MLPFTCIRLPGDEHVYNLCAVGQASCTKLSIIRHPGKLICGHQAHCLAHCVIKEIGKEGKKACMEGGLCVCFLCTQAIAANHCPDHPYE